MKTKFIMHCEDPWFSLLQTGIKQVEGRKGSPKYRAIQVSDVIVFQCDDRQFHAKVRCIDSFTSLDDYLNKVTVQKALPGIESIEEARRIYLQWSTLEEIDKHGFLGIWIDLI